LHESCNPPVADGRPETSHDESEPSNDTTKSALSWCSRRLVISTPQVAWIAPWNDLQELVYPIPDPMSRELSQIEPSRCSFRSHVPVCDIGAVIIGRLPLVFLQNLRRGFYVGPLGYAPHRRGPREPDNHHCHQSAMRLEPPCRRWYRGAPHRLGIVHDLLWITCGQLRVKVVLARPRWIASCNRRARFGVVQPCSKVFPFVVVCNSIVSLSL
jgi:hypothetical protein